MVDKKGGEDGDGLIWSGLTARTVWSKLIWNLHTHTHTEGQTDREREKIEAFNSPCFGSSLPLGSPIKTTHTHAHV